MTDSLSVEVGFEISIQLVGSRFFELYPRDSKAQNSGFHKQKWIPDLTRKHFLDSLSSETKGQSVRSGEEAR